MYADYIKRFLDVFLATVALIALSPVYLAVAVLVRLKLGSPVIFKQERPGKKDAVTGKEKIFCLYKFRSMTDERDADGNLLPDEVRLTKFGKWLRSTSLDELPELVNIIKGDMSIVGPRPLLVSYLPYYTEEERRRHDVRPGLTGLAQVNGRNYVGWDNRLTFDVNYVDNVNLFNDVKIVIKTIQMIVLKKDIATDTSKVETNFAQERQGIEEL
ncbi:MAG: sugar transferase [Lachnospiraceae bacterium]|nr:sugar transferase [Lachnospiraceae bacterium]